MKKLQPGIWIALMGLLLVVGFSFSFMKVKETPQTTREVQFTKHQIWEEFISEGLAVGDVNNDGQKDILSGPYWFEAPDWTPHEIRAPKTFDYTKGYSDSFLNFVMDVNQNGWLDFISIDFPGKGAYWYENPQGKDTHWVEHLIDTTACNESPMMADMDRNGRLGLVFGNEKPGEMVWFRPPQEKDQTAWERIPISAKNAPGTSNFSHGLGFGDVNNDGRNDVIIREGWWEAPENPEDVPWTFHEAALGEPSSQMYAYDFDADGDNDVISASAHNYGIWWHQQAEGEDGQPVFTTHLIEDSFSQTHGVALTDMNADGLPDLITGKRYFAHQGKDPGGLEPAVIYWFELQRDTNNQPTWTKHLIDDNSGAGLQVVTEDMNGDDKPDIVIANKKGIFYFEQK
jgi:hypothetical protein